MVKGCTCIFLSSEISAKMPHPIICTSFQGEISCRGGMPGGIATQRVVDSKLRWNTWKLFCVAGAEFNALGGTFAWHVQHFDCLRSVASTVLCLLLLRYWSWSPAATKHAPTVPRQSKCCTCQREVVWKELCETSVCEMSCVR